MSYEKKERPSCPQLLYEYECFDIDLTYVQQSYHARVLLYGGRAVLCNDVARPTRSRRQGTRALSQYQPVAANPILIMPSHSLIASRAGAARLVLGNRSTIAKGFSSTQVAVQRSRCSSRSLISPPGRSLPPAILDENQELELVAKELR